MNETDKTDTTPGTVEPPQTNTAKPVKRPSGSSARKSLQGSTGDLSPSGRSSHKRRSLLAGALRAVAAGKVIDVPADN